MLEDAIARVEAHVALDAGLAIDGRRSAGAHTSAIDTHIIHKIKVMEKHRDSISRALQRALAGWGASW